MPISKSAMIITTITCLRSNFPSAFIGICLQFYLLASVKLAKQQHSIMPNGFLVSTLCRKKH